MVSSLRPRATRASPVRQRGYSLLEVIVSMTIFGMFLAVLFTLTAEMRGYEKRLPINYHRHPQVVAVLARMRRDVMDGYGKNPYLNTHAGYTASDKVLIVKTVQPTGGLETIVWDFTTPGQVLRRSYNVGVPTDWVARGLPPDFSRIDIDAVQTGPNAGWATHITARDGRGLLAIDVILQPRSTQ